MTDDIPLMKPKATFPITARFGSVKRLKPLPWPEEEERDMTEIERRNRIEDVVGLPEPECPKRLPWPLVFIAGLFLGALIDMLVRTLAGV